MTEDITREKQTICCFNVATPTRSKL